MKRAKIEDEFDMSVEPETGTSVTVFEIDNPALVLIDRAKFSAFYEEMKAATNAHVPDLTSDGGRKAIASLAYKVARTKTAIDAAGKRMTEEWREKTSIVNAARREISDQLEALRVEVRAPLTAWEEAEKQRMVLVNETLDELRSHFTVSLDETAYSIDARLSAVANASFDENLFQGYRVDAEELQRQAVEILTAAVTRLHKEEADREELARLRAEQEARQLREAAKAAAKEEADRLAMEEERRAADAAKAEQLAIEQAAQIEADRQAAIIAAQEATKAEAEAKAHAARIAEGMAHAEALAAEKRRADEAEASIKAKEAAMTETLRLREVEARRLEAEQAARDKDRKHRGAVMGGAKDAMIELGADADVAKKIVLAIVAGEIPNVTLRF